MLARLKSFFRPNINRRDKQSNLPPPNDNSLRTRAEMDVMRRLAPVTNSDKTKAPSPKEQHWQSIISRDIAVTEWMEQEKRRKTKVPSYPGLEHYEIIKKLGDGAFSVVYKARDTRTRQKVALKIVRKPTTDANETSYLHPIVQALPRATERANVLKEIQIMKKIQHPNIVQLLHFKETKDYYYLVLELCEGGELFHSIVSLTYFSEPLARHVIVQVAEAVRYLHEECGIVHRDIKPENILFDPIPFVPSSPKDRMHRAQVDAGKADEGLFIEGVGGGGIGTIKLADFGLSKVIWDNATRTPCGTMGYTAPEIVMDQLYSKSVDMWALGCVLYTMLCGFPPFYDESISVLTDKVARGQYTFLSPWWDSVSDAAKDLISHLLCVDPVKRYTIHDLFAHPWVTGRPFSFSKTSEMDPVQHNDSLTTNADLDPSEASIHRRDIFSPEIGSIKEILDITYAVQRMGEENVRRQFQQHQGEATLEEARSYRLVKTYTYKREQVLLQDKNATASVLSNTTPSSPTQSILPYPPSIGFFPLDMDNATLLKNRRHPPTVNHHDPSSLKATLAV